MATEKPALSDQQVLTLAANELLKRLLVGLANSVRAHELGMTVIQSPTPK
jgi:hypothetical protein